MPFEPTLALPSEHPATKSSASAGEHQLPIRPLFLIRALDVGGAQRQVVELLKGLDPGEFHSGVAVLYHGGALEHEIAALPHVQLLPLGKRGRWDSFGFLWKLLMTTRRFKPDVIYGFQPVANELALIAGLSSHTPVIWGLRTADADYSVYHWMMGMVVRLGAFSSRLPAAIVSNSEAGLRSHEAIGYSSRQMLVIANGIDCERFAPSVGRGQPMRARWGIPDEVKVVGVVARIDPHKDHATMLSAIQLLQDQGGIRFVFVGDGPPELRRGLEDEVQARGLAGRVLVVGEEHDMPSVYAALDLLVSSSVSEGFSNVIAEAMSAGVPCVVTDVGDSARIVGETGYVVPVGQPSALAGAIRQMLVRLGPELSAAARGRVVAQFSRARMVSETSALLRRVATRGRHGQ